MFERLLRLFHTVMSLNSLSGNERLEKSSGLYETGLGYLLRVLILSFREFLRSTGEYPLSNNWSSFTIRTVYKRQLQNSRHTW